MIIKASFLAVLATSVTATRRLDGHDCVGSETNVCMKVNVFTSETGYYELNRGDFETLEGPSPDIKVKIGQKITFDQSDASNWYHPVGFSYRADGAHGDTWGADENPEVEGLGELQYLIDGEIPTCDDAGDTGLDCYEPEFFYPRGDWSGKKYKAELTITEGVAEAAVGGVLYYFCHIHSKMSGKIIIEDYEGADAEQELYSPVVNDAFDTKCGTHDVSKFSEGGDMACGEVKFFDGMHDTDFEKCLHAINCGMHWDMFTTTGEDSTDKIVTFMQQMIPHHSNAVNMAKIILKMSTQAEIDAVEDFEDTLWSIINEQNFQIHGFRNYLNPEGNLLNGTGITPSAIGRRETRELGEECVGSETNVCMKVNVFTSETGYYELNRGDFETLEGPSPDIKVKIGDKITFDQSDVSNWYHPVGFAYRADGAHGDTWGADENPEVEGLGELQYLIDGEIPTCDEAGDTGLDCYEPEFFYPRGDWSGKKYKAELTITEEVADLANGGVLYYFCHIHSKMSGKIIIEGYEGADEEQELYLPVVNDAFDTKCGTSGISKYAKDGSMDCGVEFFGGSLDTEFEMCLNAIDCQMFSEMKKETTPDGSDKIVTFMQQMIPHHINAVNMAKLILKQSTQEELDAVEDFEDVLWSIINVQNFQIHSFRNYLHPEGNYLGSTDDALTGSYAPGDESGAPSQWKNIVLGVSAAAGLLVV